MRVALIAALALVTASPALAQNDYQSGHVGVGDGARGNSSGQNSQSGHGGQNGQSGHGHDNTPPPPPPLPRCPDLALGNYGYATSVPGGPPLAADEVAIEWEVHNVGNAPYVAPSVNAQSLVLEYSTPGGTTQVAATTIPQQGSTAASGRVTLGQSASWRGTMRITLPASARRWPLRLRIDYASAHGQYGTSNDCDTGNNEVPLSLSGLPSAAAPAVTTAAATSGTH